MSLSLTTPCALWPCFPRSRGDEPYTMPIYHGTWSFSPLTRG